MTLPLAVSVSHAGLWVPPEVSGLCSLRRHEILEDGDIGAAEIFWGLEARVAAFATTDCARAIVDMNRARDDRRPDGAIKTHTCWKVPVYSRPLPEALAEELLGRFYDPYHERLSGFARAGVRLGVDCHTMAATGPPIGPDPGQPRPAVCLSHAGGTCSDEVLETLRVAFERAFAPHELRVNSPFRGGHIIRTHAAELPWVQLELSRGPFLSNEEKARRVLGALENACAALAR